MLPNATHAGVCLLLALSLCACREKKHTGDPPSAADEELALTTGTTGDSHQKLHDTLATLPGQNAISRRCQSCHQDIHHHWQGSDHGQANRLLNPAKDSEPFADKTFASGNEQWKFSSNNGDLTVTANGMDHKAGMVIGIKPLIQYLVSASGGRWQTPSAAWDPASKEWFDVFSGDMRTERDWGHWTGRGMTWNTQCAWCHMTDFRKNYDLETDSYQTHWQEMGVGCTQCHGQIANAPDEQTGCLIDITGHRKMQEQNPERVFDNCASCHSRRAEFDDLFHIGASYGDHYQLQLPTLPHLYYADGQIRDEVYVWTSLHISNMGHKGVRCTDCHDAHSTRLKFPLENNTLCMSCHAGGTNGRVSGATIIDPASHSHHYNVGKHNEVGSGHSCVDCHMSETTYMGRDPRRDHGFHVPDPQMTKDHGIPNACNKCHQDKDADWAVKWTEAWYGDKLNSPERLRQRARTRAISAVYANSPDSLAPLLAAYKEEHNPYWQATLLQIMQAFATDPQVQYLARQGVHHNTAIVRAAACMLLEFSPDNGPWLEPMLQDPIKEVRMAAAWAWRARLSERSEVLQELRQSITFTADQPSGALRMAQLETEANRLQEAEKWMKKALALDQTSPGTHEYYAVLLGRMERPAEALEQLQTAQQLDPENPRYPYLMALTQAELNRKDEAEALLRKVVAMDPGHDRAWYNLGLLVAGQNKLNEAIRCILQAEQINPREVAYPYARATIHLRKGQKMEAFEACRSCLGINRNYQPAIQLLRQIGNPNTP